MGYERTLLGLNGYMGSIINTSFTSIVLVIFGAGIYYAYPGFIGGGDIKLVVVTGLLFGFPDSGRGWISRLEGLLASPLRRTVGFPSSRTVGFPDSRNF